MDDLESLANLAMREAFLARQAAHEDADRADRSKAYYAEAVIRAQEAIERWVVAVGAERDRVPAFGATFDADELATLGGQS